MEERFIGGNTKAAWQNRMMMGKTKASTRVHIVQTFEEKLNTFYTRFNWTNPGNDREQIDIYTNQCG